jgi:hypothetical protein
MTLRRPAAMDVPRKGRSVASVAGGYGGDRGRSLGASSAAGRHKASFCEGLYMGRAGHGHERELRHLIDGSPEVVVRDALELALDDHVAHG